MANEKGLISSAIYIEGKYITEEEKAQNEAEFQAWIDNYLKTWGECQNVGCK